MDNSVQNKIETKNRIINFLNANKSRIFLLIFILLIILSSFIFFKINNEKKNIAVAEKYIEANLFLSSNKKDIATSFYEEIVLSNSKIYSILALNTLIEKNLITDKNKILDYFQQLEKRNYSKYDSDIIKFKKALYLIKIGDKEIGLNILKKLVEEESFFKKTIQEIIDKK